LLNDTVGRNYLKSINDMCSHALKDKINSDF
ncbi:unnamed protein product, partial [Larinioides sclopetarius]